jgi:hypothetical protein
MAVNYWGVEFLCGGAAARVSLVRIGLVGRVGGEDGGDADPSEEA